MYKLNYCLDCQRVFTIDDKWKYCNSKNVRELKRGKAVNIIGGKNKARFLRYKDGKVSVILYTEDKQKIIKDFEIEKIKKILWIIKFPGSFSSHLLRIPCCMVFLKSIRAES